MNDHQIETLIQRAEKQAGDSCFTGARLMAVPAVVATPFVFFSEISVIAGLFAGVCWIATASLWHSSKTFKYCLMRGRALTIWGELIGSGALGHNSSLKERELLKSIGRIYERDPQGQSLPLPQAVRLVLTWKQQQKRLRLVGDHVEQMRITRSNLQEKQKLLRELNDENTSIERALARLSDDLTPLERSCEVLRASCTRLEALLVEVDATVRRRELHREVGEITARLAPSNVPAYLEVADEGFDIERQISREIETFLQLERETGAHLRDL